MTLTNQEIFDKSYSGLKAQGEIAQRGDVGCFFYDETMPHVTCAVGQLLDDPEIREEFEGRGVGAVGTLFESSDDDLGTWVLDELNVDKSSVPLLVDLQVAHDTAETLKKALQEMRKVALKHNLKVPE